MPEIFNYEFMRLAFYSGTLVGILSPMVGIFMVVKRYSALTDTLSHVALTGIALGLIWGQIPLIWGIGISMLSGLLIEFLKKHAKIQPEVILVMFLSGSLALLSILISKIRGFNFNLHGFLFGSLTSLTLNDFWRLFIIFVLSLSVILFFYNDFLQISFSEDLAKTSGVRVKFLNYLLIFLTCLVVSTGISMVGGLLIGSLSILGVSTALQFGLGFQKTLWLGIFFSVLSVWLGLFLAFYLDFPSGSSIVVVNLVFFVISALINKIW